MLNKRWLNERREKKWRDRESWGSEFDLYWCPIVLASKGSQKSCPSSLHCLESLRLCRVSFHPLVVRWLRLGAPNAGGLGSIPSQGTRSHMLHLWVHMLQLRPKPDAHTKRIVTIYWALWGKEIKTQICWVAWVSIGSWWQSWVERRTHTCWGLVAPLPLSVYHSLFTMILWVRVYHQPHFTDQSIEATGPSSTTTAWLWDGQENLSRPPDLRKLWQINVPLKGREVEDHWTQNTNRKPALKHWPRQGVQGQLWKPHLVAPSGFRTKAPFSHSKPESCPWHGHAHNPQVPESTEAQSAYLNSPLRWVSTLSPEAGTESMPFPWACPQPGAMVWKECRIQSQMPLS